MEAVVERAANLEEAAECEAALLFHFLLQFTQKKTIKDARSYTSLGWLGIIWFWRRLQQTRLGHSSPVRWWPTKWNSRRGCRITLHLRAIPWRICIQSAFLQIPTGIAGRISSPCECLWGWVGQSEAAVTKCCECIMRGLFVLILCYSIAISTGSQMFLSWMVLIVLSDGACDYAELWLHLLRTSTTFTRRGRDRIILSWACCGLETVLRCSSGVPGSGFTGSHALPTSRWASLSVWGEPPWTVTDQFNPFWLIMFSHVLTDPVEESFQGSTCIYMYQASCLASLLWSLNVAEVVVDCCWPDETDQRPDGNADEGMKNAEHAHNTIDIFQAIVPLQVSKYTRLEGRSKMNGQVWCQMIVECLCCLCLPIICISIILHPSSLPAKAWEDICLVVLPGCQGADRIAGIAGSWRWWRVENSSSDNSADSAKQNLLKI